MTARASLVVVVMMTAVLVAGVAQLFRLRFARGDVYPPHSSLRTDPLGTRALFDALASAGVPAERNFRPLQRARLPEGATCYVLGLEWEQFAALSERRWQAVLGQVERGGRLVISFFPPALERPVHPRAASGAGAAPGKGSAPGEDAGPGDKLPPEEEKTPGRDRASPNDAGPRLRERLQVESRRLPRPGGEGWRADLQTTEADGAVPLPAELPWRSAQAFEGNPEAAWRSVYGVDEHTVVAARPFGLGSIVLLGDGFLLSNEAMRSAREPALLAWLQGAGGRAVFDESHLGVEENSGVATLARRYGLEHAAMALALVAALFVWRRRSSLLPPEQPGSDGQPGRAGELAGRDTAAGLVSLLRRTVGARGLFAACLQEYRRSHAWRRISAVRRRELEMLADGDTAADPLRAVRRAHGIVARRD